MSQSILNLDELSELERRYANQFPAGELMRRAGAALAEVVRERTPAGGHVAIVCGPGNNGGDGFSCAVALKAWGFQVSCVLPGCAAPKAEDALAFFEAFQRAGGTVVRDPYALEKVDTVVDALLGTGARRPMAGELLDAAQWINERRALHISADIPSGLDAMTGNWTGGIPGVKADITVTFFCAKAGLYLNTGVDVSGEVLVRELDCSIPLASLASIDTDDFRPVCEPRVRNCHKGDFGTLAVIGGRTGMVGAAVLAARAGITLGAGRVLCECLSDRAPALDPLYPELMMCDGPIDLKTVDAIAIGCGLGRDERAKRRLEEAIAAPVPLVVDADALRLMADDPTLQDAVLARTAHTVLTPHVGEAASLLRRPMDKVLTDPVGAARELSVQTGAITVLKGAGTVVSLRSSRAWINPQANPMLATAGSGDVLCGMVGAFFAQGFDLVSSTLAAVWFHAQANADAHAGITASDIAPAAAQALSDLRAKAR